MKSSNLVRQHWAALRALLVLTVIVGIAYPVVHLADRPAARPAGQGRRVDHRGRRKAGGQQPDRAVVHRQRRQPAAAVLPEPAVGGRATATTRWPPARATSGRRASSTRPDKPSLLTLVCARSAAVGELEGVDGTRPFCTGERRRRRAVGDRSARRTRQRRPPDPGGQRQRTVRDDIDAVPQHLRRRARRVRHARRGLQHRPDRADPRQRPRRPAGARRRGHRQRQRARPPHLDRLRRPAGQPGRQGARRQRRPGPAGRRRQHRRSLARVLRRAHGQRAGSSTSSWTQKYPGG